MHIQVPKGWVETGEYPEEVLLSSSARFTNRFPTDESSYDFSGNWEIVDFEIRQEEIVRENDSAYLLTSDVTEFARSGDRVITRTVTKSLGWRAKPGHEADDICVYCGTNNTGHDGRSWRLGWDCYNCGGN